eukprot:COSAG02_NODE_1355_length_13099_cov_10.562923_6_plen_110_part_00
MSPSPEIHNVGFAKNGYPHRYERFDTVRWRLVVLDPTAPERRVQGAMTLTIFACCALPSPPQPDVGAVMDKIRLPTTGGGSVTIPHKVSWSRTIACSPFMRDCFGGHRT